MKKFMLGMALGLAIAFNANADIGTVKEGFGKILQGDHFTVVKKALKKDEQLKRHNHEGESVIFTVLNGKISVLLDDTEKHDISVGQVLNFDGKHFIQGEATEDTVILVTLVGEHHEHKHK
ncbi:cupin [Aggregatibacter actinomycetemcomitans]|uniref:cupin n=1 Tax=Aggregatibacter actinomycetemcomitans TaxID=714 RepID=UPI00197C77AB|nr:cupin [Aggregatibacter actinomycetemcomitans]MBN6080381.1 cupin [Aggregatibacter actinomycetemcomitans]